MADFSKSYTKTIANEGGYANDASDPGGETYKGIARNIFGKWGGWSTIDLAKRAGNFPANLETNTDLQQEVETFYQVEFWNRMKGDDITDQDKADIIFDFAVNAGLGTAISLAQLVTGADTDGIAGLKTVEAINAADKALFVAQYTLAKVARYITIVKKRPASRKYFYGWICRAMGENA